MTVWDTAEGGPAHIVGVTITGLEWYLEEDSPATTSESSSAASNSSLLANAIYVTDLGPQPFEYSNHRTLDDLIFDRIEQEQAAMEGREEEYWRGYYNM